jgi:hypothetical protein
MMLNLLGVFFESFMQQRREHSVVEQNSTMCKAFLLRCVTIEREELVLVRSSLLFQLK